MLKYLFFALTFASLVFGFERSAFAWTVETTQGQATVEVEGKAQPLLKGQVVIANQVIVTGSDGRVLLKDGDSQVWVSSNSEFSVGEPPSVAQKKPSVMQLLKGKVRAHLAKDEGESESHFKVRMRTVVCGVRGTEFFAAVGDADEKVCTLEGHVVVASVEPNKSGVSDVWELPAGKGLFISNGQPGEVKSTSNEQVIKWVRDTSEITTYAVPFRLRSVTVSDSVRADTSFSSYQDSRANSGGAAAASMFAGSYKFKDNFAALLRLGTASNSPPAGAASGVTTTNPILGVAYSPVVDLDLRAQLFFGLALPLGSGSGNSPDAGVKAANGSGALARAAMDNAAFAVNYFTVIAGADLAYLKKDWTLQVESTLFQLLRNSGENVDRDAVRTNLTAGFELGYAFQPLVSMIGELHYQRWLNNDTVFSMVAPTVENLSLAIGPRFSFKMDDVTFKPGISYERGLVGPVVSGGFPASIANNEQIIFVDLPIVF